MKILCSVFCLSIFILACNNNVSDKVNPMAPEQAVVEETMNSGGYTYMLIAEQGEKKWIAASQMQINVGDAVYYEGGMTMTDFHSETLNRNFDKIEFVEKASTQPLEGVKSEEGDLLKQHHASKLATSKKAIEIEPLSDGISIGDLYSKKADLKGKKVKIKGQVTKFNEAIMNTNWVHIQDGSDFEGKFDVTITTDATAAVGDVIIVEGKVSLEKDLGHGYFYEILIEDAEIEKVTSKE